MFLRRTKYLIYYLLKLDRAKFKKFFSYVNRNEIPSSLTLYKDIIHSVYRYNISILDYFYFRFYQLDAVERASYAGTGHMYEFQLKMNPKKDREVLENKFMFMKSYAPFIHHAYTSKKEFLTNETTRAEILEGNPDKLILKSSDGQCGEGIELINVASLNSEELLDRVSKSGNDLVEQCIEQHTDLMRLSSTGLNTLRIFTQLDENNLVHFLGARLRITVNSYVDNLAAGNLAAPVDLELGIVNGPAVYSDITQSDQRWHPITKEKIEGFKIPFWKESLNLVREAATLIPSNKSIGWDVAITNKGPELLEGNHNWCKLLWQLPVKHGLKRELEKFI